MSAPEISKEHRRLAAQMRRGSYHGWYTGDVASLDRYGQRAVVQGAVEPELQISLLFSRDKMHHSVGWWRNAEYEYCYHLSISAQSMETDWSSHKWEQVPRAEARYWTHAFFPRDYDKVWMEPGGTDPRLTKEDARMFATFWHMRVFLEPQILSSIGEPFVPFIPKGEVYDLTRWIDGLTPAKVDR